MPHEIEIYEKESELSKQISLAFSDDDISLSQVEAIIFINEKPLRTSSKADETTSYFSNALTMKFTVVFSTYSDGSSVAKYYKLSSLSSSVVRINSGYSMDYINLFLFNNGITRYGGGKTNQTSAKNIGGSLNGTVYGNSSWEPTYTWMERTQAYAEFRIIRNGTKYESSWERTF